MTYDSWKARSPDDDLGDPSMYEKPDQAQELADWEDERQQALSDMTKNSNPSGGRQ